MINISELEVSGVAGVKCHLELKSQLILEGKGIFKKLKKKNLIILRVSLTPHELQYVGFVMVQHTLLNCLLFKPHQVWESFTTKLNFIS